MHTSHSASHRRLLFRKPTMRIPTLAIAALAQLASLASAAPLSIQPETSPNEDAMLLPRQVMCTNYPGTIAGQ